MIKITDQGRIVNVVQIDVKAFDKISHIRLVQKIKSHRIYGGLINWIQNVI